VFSVLRGSGMKLPERLTAILEVESGSNDPMAIFLTLGLIGVITGSADSARELILLFVAQFGLGTLAGLVVGRLAAWAVNQHEQRRGASQWSLSSQPIARCTSAVLRKSPYRLPAGHCAAATPATTASRSMGCQPRPSPRRSKRPVGQSMTVMTRSSTTARL
jgi:hypothetical protein